MVSANCQHTLYLVILLQCLTSVTETICSTAVMQHFFRYTISVTEFRTVFWCSSLKMKSSALVLTNNHWNQGFVKGEKFCFRYLDFYFWHHESTFTTSQFPPPASWKSQDINKVLLLLQDLDLVTWLLYLLSFADKEVTN